MIKIKKAILSLASHNIPSMKELEKKYKKNIIKMNYNENLYGCSPLVDKWIKSDNDIKGFIYPDIKPTKLLDAISKLWNVKNENILVANGSDAIIDLMPRVFLDNGEESIITELTYGRQIRTCKITGNNVIEIPQLDNFNYDIDKFLSSINKKTKLIYVTNPNMPTGTYINRDKLLSFISKIPSHILIVIDEAYVEFADAKDFPYDTSQWIKKFDNLIILHTFSKFYGLSGFRIGYALAQPYLIEAMHKTYQPFSANKYALYAATAALKDSKWYQDIKDHVIEEKNRLYQVFEQLNIKYIKSQANYIFVITENQKWTNVELREHLLVNQNICIRCVRKIGLRITVGTPEQNTILIKGITDFINNKF